jgi:predicted transcriptional regulator
MYRNPVAVETVMLELVPVTAPDATSEAVIVCAPGVTSTAENVPAPLTRVLLGDSTAEASELVKCTVPG